MSNPLISIIIPTYNRKHFLVETLQSIVQQNYTNWECVIIDDGSTDGTEEAINKTFASENRVSFYKRPSNVPKGANSSRNYGFKKSKGQYVNWFDSDDIMLPNFLSEKAAYIDNSYDLIIAAGVLTDENLKTKRVLEVIQTDAIYKDFVLSKLNLLTPSILFKRSFLEGKQLYSDELLTSHETEFYSRILYKCKPTQYKIVDIPTYLYRSHNDSLTVDNTSYRNDFKKSESFVLMTNLKRALELRDADLIQSAYRMLVNQLFRAIKYKDEYNIRFILKTFETCLGNKNKGLISLLKALVFMSQKFGIHKLRWDKFIKRKGINYER